VSPKGALTYQLGVHVHPRPPHKCGLCCCLARTHVAPSPVLLGPTCTNRCSTLTLTSHHLCTIRPSHTHHVPHQLSSHLPTSASSMFSSLQHIQGTQPSCRLESWRAPLPAFQRAKVSTKTKSGQEAQVPGTSCNRRHHCDNVDEPRNRGPLRPRHPPARRHKGQASSGGPMA
jgi:hypothetical protein